MSHPNFGNHGITGRLMECNKYLVIRADRSIDSNLGVSCVTCLSDFPKNFTEMRNTAKALICYCISEYGIELNACVK